MEQILAGVQTYRNPRLVNILSKLHYIENFGTGIPRILKAYERTDKKPIFDPSENFFILKLPNMNYSDPIIDPIIDPITDALSDFDLLVMRTIKNNQGLNVPKLLEIIVEEDSNATIDKIKNSLKRHLEKYCEFRGSRSSGGYYIK